MYLNKEEQICRNNCKGCDRKQTNCQGYTPITEEVLPTEQATWLSLTLHASGKCAKCNKVCKRGVHFDMEVHREERFYCISCLIELLLSHSVEKKKKKELTPKQTLICPDCGEDIGLLNRVYACVKCGWSKNKKE